MDEQVFRIPAIDETLDGKEYKLPSRDVMLPRDIALPISWSNLQAVLGENKQNMHNWKTALKPILSSSRESDLQDEDGNLLFEGVEEVLSYCYRVSTRFWVEKEGRLVAGKKGVNLRSNMIGSSDIYVSLRLKTIEGVPNNPGEQVLDVEVERVPDGGALVPVYEQKGMLAEQVGEALLKDFMETLEVYSAGDERSHQERLHELRRRAYATGVLEGRQILIGKLQALEDTKKMAEQYNIDLGLMDLPPNDGNGHSSAPGG